MATPAGAPGQEQALGGDGPVDNSGRAGALLALAALNLVWGGSLPATKVALEGFGPLTLAALRLVLATLCFAPLLWRARDRLPPAGTVIAIGALGVVGFTGTQALQALGTGGTTAAAATVLASTGPLWIAFLAPLLVRERPGALALGGIALALGGVALIVEPWREGAAEGALAADAVVLLSSGAFALYTVLGKRVGASSSPLVFTALSCVGGAAAALPLAAVEAATRQPTPAPLHWAVVGYLALVVTFAGFVVWVWGIRRVSAARAGAFLFLQPLSGLLLSSLVLHEALPPAFLAGAALVLAGVYLAATRGD